MYCPKCGKENPDDVHLCQYCSWVLTSISITEQNPNARTSGLAITSLVLAILSFFTLFLTMIPAMIVGIVSLVKIEKSGGQLKGKGLAIAGIAAPAVMLPFVAGMMMAILLPALAQTRQIARRTLCATNLSGLGKAMLIYAADCNEMYPCTSNWCDLLKPYCESNEEIFTCPSAGKRRCRYVCTQAEKGRCYYAINPNARPNAPPDVVLLFETHSGWNQSGGPEILSTENHNGEGCNVLFNDLHVRFIKTEDVNDLKWTAEQK